VVKGELTDVVWVGGEEPTPEVAAASHISRSSSNEPPAAEAADAAHAGSSNGGAAGNGSGGDVPAGRGRGESGPADGEGGGKGGGGAPAGAALELEPASPSKYSEGRLCVRIRVNPSAEDKSEVHIDRQAGDVLQFHSFYRDVRNQLAGANGWVENHGRYEHEVFPSQADFK